ncbi:ABC transporter ATP-binding protein [Salinispora tropica]|uniref:ABC transporter related n=1 Tax=Salinispora tropica (strain ATCC BAA-916 / DSM 44818 / JCM 13857 / NBRC 105044 / CNB-440) TaxID=369723 RepID=A4X540_SALTO|nr:ABC transporter ATP-binding protein [Salinispora tropica]ABP53990.1 ABC transporter related [Salinispora tropica CNB-440]
MFRFFENAADPFGVDEPADAPQRVLPYLISEFRPLRFILAAGLLATVVSAGVELWLIAYAGRLVDTLAGADSAALWQTHGMELFVVGALILFVRPLLALFNEGLDDIAFRPNARTRALWRAHRRVSRQPVGWFREDLSGRIATRVREGSAAAAMATYTVVHTLAFVFTYIVGSVWLLGSVDPRLVLPLAVWILLYAGLMTYVVPRYRAASEHHQDADSAVTGLLVDSYANVDTLALLDVPAAADRAVFAAERRARLRIERLEVTMNVGMVCLSGILMVGLIGYGILLWQAGAAPIGMVAATLALTFRITAMAEWLLDGVSALFGCLGTLRRALRTIAQPPVVTDRPNAGALAVRGGAIRITNVSHHYGTGSGGLDGLSLEIAAGEKVRDNIGLAAAGEESIVAAARQAVAHDFITVLSDQGGRTGYHAHVGERGVKLSGGQRQRIALARAIHKDAPILILDEATSALDSEVEAAIQDTMDKVMAGCTVIAVAHRLSTIARMDRIVVLDQGRIVEDGTHAELLRHNGRYAALWARQAGGFLGR